MIRGLLQWLTVVLSLVVAASAFAQPVPTPADAGQPQPGISSPQAPIVSDPDYAIGEGDVVEVVVVGNSEYNTRVRVGRDGSVVLPLIGAIPAAGQSPSALGEKVAASLKAGRFYANPIVRVELIGIRSRYVTVLGNVSSPGLLPLDRAYRLSEIIARVGGSTSSGTPYVVLTRASGESKQYSIEALATGGGELDPVVAAGDKIYIPAAEKSTFYISGEVKNPGAFVAQENMTIRVAIAKAGGVTENGNEKRFTLVREGKPVKGLTLDSPIMAGDVVTIKARMF